MNYFAGINSVEQVKSTYRKLAMRHHPDRGGDDETMKLINCQYHEALQRCHGATTKGSGGKEHTYYYNEAGEQAVIDKLAELIGLKLPDIRIMLVGTWVWIDGATKLVKDQLKSAGLHWHPQREKWYWHTGSYRRGSSNADFASLATKYGYREFETDKRKQLKA